MKAFLIKGRPWQSTKKDLFTGSLQVCVDGTEPNGGVGHLQWRRSNERRLASRAGSVWRADLDVVSARLSGYFTKAKPSIE